MNINVQGFVPVDYWNALLAIAVGAILAIALKRGQAGLFERGSDLVAITTSLVLTVQSLRGVLLFDRAPLGFQDIRAAGTVVVLVLSFVAASFFLHTFTSIVSTETGQTAKINPAAYAFTVVVVVGGWFIMNGIVDGAINTLKRAVT